MTTTGRDSSSESSIPSKRSDGRAVAGAVSPPRVEFIERSHQRSAAG
jgi:hypothetical protein